MGLDWSLAVVLVRFTERLGYHHPYGSALLESQGGLLPIYERIKVLILIRKPNSPNPCLKLITKIVFRITWISCFHETLSLLNLLYPYSEAEIWNHLLRAYPKRRSEGVTNFREFIWCRAASLMSRMCGSRIQGPAWTSLLLVWFLGRLDVLVLGLVAGVDNSSKFNRVCI